MAAGGQNPSRACLSLGIQSERSRNSLKVKGLRKLPLSLLMKWIMQLPALSLAVAVMCLVAGPLCPQLCLSPPAAGAVKCPRVVTKGRGRRFGNLLGEKKGRESKLGKKLRSVWLSSCSWQVFLLCGAPQNSSASSLFLSHGEILGSGCRTAMWDWKGSVRDLNKRGKFPQNCLVRGGWWWGTNEWLPAASASTAFSQCQPFCAFGGDRFCLRPVS